MKEKKYELILQQLQALLEGEHDMIANMANMAALLFHELPDLNWAGFYLMKNNELVLGPFQGKVACMHIPSGKGVLRNLRAATLYTAGRKCTHLPQPYCL